MTELMCPASEEELDHVLSEQRDHLRSATEGDVRAALAGSGLSESGVRGFGDLLKFYRGMIDAMLGEQA